MKSALILAIVAAAYCLTACGGGGDDDEPEQACATHSPAAEGMDKVPATPCRAVAQ